MEHVLLSVITVWSKEFAVGGARLDDNLIHSNPMGASINRQGNGDREISLGSLNSGTEIQRIGFGRNKNGGIGVNSPITTGSISPQITRTKQGSFDIFDYIKGISDLSYRSASWNDAEKVKVKTLEATELSKMLSARIILKLKKLGAKIL